jgi:hypothetical protein
LTVFIPGQFKAVFNPSIVGISGPGFADIAASAMAATPSFFSRNAATMPVVVTGGSTLLRYLPDRMKLEIAKMAPWTAGNATAGRSGLLAVPGRAKAAFSGASTLGCGYRGFPP